MIIDTNNRYNNDKKDIAYTLVEIIQAFNCSEDIRSKIIISMLASTGV